MLRVISLIHIDPSEDGYQEVNLIVMQSLQKEDTVIRILDSECSMYITSDKALLSLLVEKITSIGILCR